MDGSHDWQGIQKTDIIYFCPWSEVALTSFSKLTFLRLHNGSLSSSAEVWVAVWAAFPGVGALLVHDTRQAGFQHKMLHYNHLPGFPGHLLPDLITMFFISSLC